MPLGGCHVVVFCCEHERTKTRDSAQLSLSERASERAGGPTRTESRRTKKRKGRRHAQASCSDAPGLPRLHVCITLIHLTHQVLRSDAHDRTGIDTVST